jgi:LPS O-antigen subunit length determinant protein (WzzB/FepE family)
MNSEDLINNLDDHDDIDVRELFSIIWNKKKFLAISSSFSAVIAIIIALYLPNIFTSSAILSPADDQQSNAGMSQAAGLASIVGMTLPAQAADKTTEAIERVQSFEFFNKFFLPNILLKDLMAVSRWNPESNNISYIRSLINSPEGTWRNEEPSSQSAYKQYKKMMTISQDKKTSFVTLSIKHKSPFVAQEWAQLIIDKINQSMRDEDKNKALRSVKYLNAQIRQTSYEQVKQSISALQQQQFKSLMLIEANDDYIFKVLNSPIAPEFKSEPRRSLMVIFGTLIGVMLSIFFVLINHYRSKDIPE